MKIENFEQYVAFVRQVAAKYEMMVVQIHTYIFEFGTDIVPYFRILWSPDKQSPMISFHVDTRNSDAIQFFNQVQSIAENVVLLESYYVSEVGETTMGDNAYIAAQVEAEASLIETTTQAILPEESEGEEGPAAFISSIPVYTYRDPRGLAQYKAQKKLKQGMGDL